MPSPHTIFFDTYFYVDLAAMPEDEVAQVEGAMNALSIRPVLSAVILEELLSNDTHPDRDQVLAKVMLSLDHPSLCLEPNLSWEVIRQGVEDRHTLANLCRDINLLKTLGEARATVARSPGSARQRANLEAHLNRVVTKVGFESIQEFAFVVTRDLWTQLGPLLKKAEVDLGGLELPDLERATPETMKSFAEELLERLPREHLVRIMQDQDVIDGVLSNDPRPRKLALGKANQTELSRLGNEFRDLRRISEFIQNAAQIDLFQMDKAQFDRMEAMGPGHPLVEAGLAARCFWSEARKPLAAIALLRGMFLTDSRRPE